MRANADALLASAVVELCPYRRAHVERYHEWMSDEDTLRATASERLTLAEEYAMCEQWARDETKCTFIVRDARTREMVGDVNLFFGVDHEDAAAAEIECMIGERSMRRKGYAREALEVFMAYGAVVLGVTTFVAKIGFDNAASLNLFAGLGYVERSSSEIFREKTLTLPARDARTGEVHSRFQDRWSRVRVQSYDAHEARRLEEKS